MSSLSGRIVFAFAAAAWSAWSGAESLAEAVALAIKHFPDVRASSANRAAAAAVVDQARGALYPTIDASLGAGRETSDNVTTRLFGRDVTLTRTEAEVSLSQLLFDGGAARGQVRRFSARSDSAAYQVATAAEFIGLRAATSYLEVLRARSQVALAEENVAAHERTFWQVQLLAESGKGRRSDAQQAAARLALAQSSLMLLRGQLRQAEAAYRHVVGRDPGALQTPESFAGRVPERLESALEDARSRHPAVLSAEKELAAARADRDSSRARLAPRLNLEMGVSRNHDLDGVRGLNADRFAMLRLRYNLLRGGSDMARIQELEARIDEAIANAAKARNDVERDLRLAWETLEADRVRLPQLELYARTSVEVLQAYRSQFRIGQRSLLDVLNAENEQYTARGNLVNGVYAIAAGETRILAGIGRLLEALRVNPPDAAQLGGDAGGVPER